MREVLTLGRPPRGASFQEEKIVRKLIISKFLPAAQCQRGEGQKHQYLFATALSIHSKIMALNTNAKEQSANGRKRVSGTRKFYCCYSSYFLHQSSKYYNEFLIIIKLLKKYVFNQNKNVESFDSLPMDMQQ